MQSCGHTAGLLKACVPNPCLLSNQQGLKSSKDQMRSPKTLKVLPLVSIGLVYQGGWPSTRVPNCKGVVVCQASKRVQCSGHMLRLMGRPRRPHIQVGLGTHLPVRASGVVRSIAKSFSTTTMIRVALLREAQPRFLEHGENLLCSSSRLGIEQGWVTHARLLTPRHLQLRC